MSVQDTIYSSTSTLAEDWEDNEVQSIIDFGESLSKHLNFIKKLFGTKAIKIDSIRVSFFIKTSYRESKAITLDNNFWINVALGKENDSSPN